MFRKTLLIAAATALAGLATPAAADFVKVSDKTQFVSLISGKTLTRPLIKLKVSSSGVIEGTGATWPVSGQWTWKDGFFCRDLQWGDRNLGYNCQEVRVNESSVRFTSDRGTGDSADFRLR